MRCLLTILSLILFISVESKAVELDMGDLRRPDSVDIWICYTGEPFEMIDTYSQCQDIAKEQCKILNPNYNEYISYQSESYVQFSCKDSGGRGYNNILTAGKDRQTTEPCHSRTDDYIHSVEVDGETMCAKAIDDPYGNCPEPTENDYPQFGTGGGQQEHCYTNPDGSQCKITTDENGDFTLPFQYGSQEPTICHDDPVDSPDPDPMPDVPETPDADDPTPDDNSQGDDSDKTVDIDALNQINDNLTIINDSINTASDENSERLNLIKDNIDNSNLYLDAIEENTGKALGALQQQTALLAEIRDKESAEEIPIFTAAPVKTGGLYDYFTAEELTNLSQQTEEKKTELKDLFDQIQQSISTKFEMNLSTTGTYEEHEITAYGVTEDIGLKRFSDPFFKQLAPIILLVCSFFALGILLWK